MDGQSFRCFECDRISFGLIWVRTHVSDVDLFENEFVHCVSHFEQRCRDRTEVIFMILEFLKILCMNAKLFLFFI